MNPLFFNSKLNTKNKRISDKLRGLTTHVDRDLKIHMFAILYKGRAKNVLFETRSTINYWVNPKKSKDYLFLCTIKTNFYLIHSTKGLFADSVLWPVDWKTISELHQMHANIDVYTPGALSPSVFIFTRINMTIQFDVLLLSFTVGLCISICGSMNPEWEMQKKCVRKGNLKHFWRHDQLPNYLHCISRRAVTTPAYRYWVHPQFKMRYFSPFFVFPSKVDVRVYVKISYCGERLIPSVCMTCFIMI